MYGWGTTSSGGPSSSKLLEVSVPVVTSTQCATSMGPMEGGQICAGGEEGKDSCQVTFIVVIKKNYKEGENYSLLSSLIVMRIENICNIISGRQWRPYVL